MQRKSLISLYSSVNMNIQYEYSMFRIICFRSEGRRNLPKISETSLTSKVRILSMETDR